jgi:hypothetical protein
MTIVAHRPRAVRDQIIDREVRRLELTQRVKRRKNSPADRRRAGLDPGAWVSGALNSR